jgi:hypothetical protein
VLLPLALCVGMPSRRAGSPRPGQVIGLHPVFLGFVAGTAVFWAYGFLVDAASFWREHVRTHLVDRLAHVNPLGYTGYPTLAGLWQEFWQHTGYILLPLGWSAMLVSLGPAAWCHRCGLPCRTLRAWLGWSVLLSIVFSVVDWRMTKHLMPLLLPLHLAPVAWTAAGRAARPIILAMLAALLVWNLWVVRSIVSNFEAFSVTPAW